MERVDFAHVGTTVSVIVNNHHLLYGDMATRRHGVFDHLKSVKAMGEKEAVYKFNR